VQIWKRLKIPIWSENKKRSNINFRVKGEKWAIPQGYEDTCDTPVTFANVFCLKAIYATLLTDSKNQGYKLLL